MEVCEGFDEVTDDLDAEVEVPEVFPVDSTTNCFIKARDIEKLSVKGVIEWEYKNFEKLYRSMWYLASKHRIVDSLGGADFVKSEIRQITFLGIDALTKVVMAIRNGKLEFSNEKWTRNVLALGKEFGFNDLLVKSSSPFCFNCSRIGDLTDAVTKVIKNSFPDKGVEEIQSEVLNKLKDLPGVMWDLHLEAKEKIPIRFKYKSNSEAVSYLIKKYNGYVTKTHWTNMGKKPKIVEGSNESALTLVASNSSDEMGSIVGTSASTPEKELEALRLENALIRFVDALNEKDRQLFDDINCSQLALDPKRNTRNKEYKLIERLEAFLITQDVDKDVIQCLLSKDTRRSPSIGTINRTVNALEGEQPESGDHKKGIREKYSQQKLATEVARQNLMFSIAKFLRQCQETPGGPDWVVGNTAITLSIPEIADYVIKSFYSFKASWKESVDPATKNYISCFIDWLVNAEISLMQPPETLANHWGKVTEALITHTNNQATLRGLGHEMKELQNTLKKLRADPTATLTSRSA